MECKIEIKEPTTPLYRHLVRGDYFRLKPGGPAYLKTGTRAVCLADGTEKSVDQEAKIAVIPPGTKITIEIGDDGTAKQ